LRVLTSGGVVPRGREHRRRRAPLAWRMGHTIRRPSEPASSWERRCSESGGRKA
jgi:hypothetical protein